MASFHRGNKVSYINTCVTISEINDLTGITDDLQLVRKKYVDSLRSNLDFSLVRSTVQDMNGVSTVYLKFNRLISSSHGIEIFSSTVRPTRVSVFADIVKATFPPDIPTPPLLLQGSTFTSYTGKTIIIPQDILINHTL